MKESECVVGVIGGLGNEAMVDLSEKITAIPGHEKRNWVLFGNSRLAYKPSELELMGSGQDTTELRREATAEHTVELMQYLGCDLLGVACNSAHELFREVLSTRPLPLVDMLKETARSISETSGPVLIMGVTSLVEAGLYQEALKECGHASAIPSAENQAKVMDAIYNTSFGLKTGQVSKDSERLLCEVLSEECQKQGCGHVILGCTEIPLVFTPQDSVRLRGEKRIPNVHIIDGSNVLAEALVSTTCESATKAIAPPLPGQHVDWLPPATFHVSSLDEMVAIQRRVFRQTDDFLKQRGLAVMGSYMHLPTLFVAGEMPDAIVKLSALNIQPFSGEGEGVGVESILEAHFESMS